MPPYLRDLLLAPLEPARFVLDVALGQRIYWLFMLSSLGIAAGVYLLGRRARERSFRGLLRFLFPREVWLHPSATLDLRLMVAKAIVRAGLFAPLLVTTAQVSAVVAASLIVLLGEPSSLAWPEWSIGASFIVVFFLADDLTRFLLHRALHRVPRLWEIHKVHHSAEVLTPFTLYRSHPVEGLLYAIRDVLTIGPVVGVFFYLFRTRLDAMPFSILGMDALGFAFSFLGANLRHSHVWLSYGPRVERWLISPAQHQIHHSVDPRHYDRNYGTFLAVWDRLGGSLTTTTAEPEPLVLGLPEETRNHRGTVGSALLGPLVAALRPRRTEGAEGHPIVERETGSVRSSEPGESPWPSYSSSSSSPPPSSSSVSGPRPSS